MKNKQLTTKIQNIKKIDSQLIDTLFLLFEQYYLDVSKDQFIADLKEKTHIIIMRNSEKKIVGFSTQKREWVTLEGKKILALFSGDTVIDKDYWGKKDLQKAFFWFILESKLLSRGAPLYWFLISKGFKTYLMMRKNFRRSYPNPLTDFPPFAKKLSHFYYQKRYGNDYMPESNLIIFKNIKGAVKESFQDLPAGPITDLNIQYFLEKNPHYDQGHELACITQIGWSDFLFHIKKFFIR